MRLYHNFYNKQVFTIAIYFLTLTQSCQVEVVEFLESFP